METVRLPYKSETSENFSKMDQVKKNTDTNNSNEKQLNKNCVVAAKRTRRVNSIEEKAKTTKSVCDSPNKNIVAAAKRTRRANLIENKAKTTKSDDVSERKKT